VFVGFFGHVGLFCRSKDLDLVSFVCLLCKGLEEGRLFLRS